MTTAMATRMIRSGIRIWYIRRPSTSRSGRPRRFEKRLPTQNWSRRPCPRTATACRRSCAETHEQYRETKDDRGDPRAGDRTDERGEDQIRDRVRHARFRGGVAEDYLRDGYPDDKDQIEDDQQDPGADGGTRSAPRDKYSDREEE